MSLLGYSHAVGEALVPVAPQLLTPLTVASLAYIALSSIDRGNKTSMVRGGGGGVDRYTHVRRGPATAFV